MNFLEGDIIEIHHKGFYTVRRITFSTTRDKNVYLCVSDELRNTNTSQWYGVHELLASPFLDLDDVLKKYKVEKIGTIWDKKLCKQYSFKPSNHEYKFQALLDSLINLAL